MLLLDNQEFTSIYTTNAPSLENRLFFTDSDPGQEDAAFISRGVHNLQEINTLSEAGYMIRTTVDGGPAKSWIPLQYSDVEKNTIITDTTAGEWSSLLVVGSGISSSIISSTKEIDTSNSQKVSSSEDIILQEK